MDKEQAVTVDFDLLRSGASAARSFGIDLFGMSLISSKVVEKEGTVVVQTPGGVRTILFDSLHKENGYYLNLSKYVKK